MKARTLVMALVILTVIACGVDNPSTQTATSLAAAADPSPTVAVPTFSPGPAATATLAPLPAATPEPAQTATPATEPTSTPRPQPTATPIVIPDYSDDIAALQAQINTLRNANQRMENCIGQLVDIFLIHRHAYAGGVDYDDTDPPSKPPVGFLPIGSFVTLDDMPGCYDFTN